MSPSPDPAAEQTPPVSNLAHLHKQQRNRAKIQDTPEARRRNASRYERGRRDRIGDKVTRIYPTPMYVVPLHPTSRLSTFNPDSVTEPSHHLKPDASPPRPPLAQSTIMRPRLHYCRLWVPREPQLHSIPTTGLNPYPSTQPRVRPTAAV